MSYTLPGKAASLLALSASLNGQVWAGRGLAASPPPDFVSVNASGNGFLVNGARFVVSGANQVGRHALGRLA